MRRHSLFWQSPICLSCCQISSQRLLCLAYGTLSIIARAARLGKVKSFYEAVEALKAAGLYLSGDVIETVQKAFTKTGRKKT